MPRKPHPFRNEYHTVCCGQTAILFALEMVEGKDAPAERTKDPNIAAHGRTGAMILRLSSSIWGTAKVLVLDSGFCVLKTLVALRQNGLFAAALINKWWYWPNYVPGVEIAKKMDGDAVGDVKTIQGSLDGTPYSIFCMKEPEYIMKMMSTYGGDKPPVGQHDVHRVIQGSDGGSRSIDFKYPETVANHFKYRHMVDDHNNLRHALPSLEDIWKTHRWSNRVFFCCF